MLSFAINHMTMAHASFEALLDLAAELGCVGIEVRNDLDVELFDGETAIRAGAAARARGLRILALSQVNCFNDITAASSGDAESLMAIAADCGAEAITLIPTNDGRVESDSQRRVKRLRALETLRPMLQSYKLLGLIEPIGFSGSSLSSKTEAIEAVQELEAADTFKLVHDTFHHCLAGGGSVFPDHTGLVHVSGVTEAGVTIEDMRDEHRVLVTAEDRLANVAQLSDLSAGGYTGAVSIEAFSSQVHAFSDPAMPIAGSFDYIASSLTAHAA